MNRGFSGACDWKNWWEAVPQIWYPPGEPDPSKRFPVVGELQLTTLASVKLKKVQHKVYELLRAWEGGRGHTEAYNTILNSVCKPV